MGATSVELIRNLERNDTYYFFGFQDNVDELHRDLCRINHRGVQLTGIGNDRGKKYDSYVWNLAKLLLEWREKYGTQQRIDVAYLDGAHSFLFDGGAACLLKEMCTPGGYIVLDDIHWKISDSPTCNPQANPKILDDYTLEQINSCQIEMVRQCFLDHDERFQRAGQYNRIAIFQRKLLEN